MTDNEIIKALECCSNAEPCENCPYQKQCDETDLAEIALDLINRQKAEIKKQRIVLEQIEDTCNPLPFETDYDKAIKQAKAEAVKEFAERLTDKADLKVINAFESSWVISQELIDNLVKEMVGENK